ncbi:specifically androgen-regulated gene protein [Thalassophryne amazonica]|uniref:specifically androgen-regulated gene protein n=1 Tax=Thalassophryne amazonica TaxID=390379 RepID=UPI0014722747|nr:specifically androgen-regulated gene protein [Thalassophryne amazonica]XP_034028758.1 specifically androgen-regulated gene protein [Thalassophryne amazonica]
MSKSGTWPGGIALEPSGNMDSAGSCDSVISMNSADSEDSMEHLSAEERACLLYLEEMIESLEVQEDSGLSNDEPDSGRVAKKSTHLTAHDIFKLKSEPKKSHKLSTPLPEGTGRFPPRVPEVPVEPETRSFAIQHKPECYALNHTAEPQSLVSAQPSDTTELKQTASQTEASLAAGGDGNPPNTQLYSGPPPNASKGAFGLIPPPSDFRDESAPQPRKVKAISRPAVAAGRHSTKSVNVEQLLHRVPIKGNSATSCTSKETSLMPGGEAWSPPHTSGFQSNSFTPTVPRSPPAVAPKPAKNAPSIMMMLQKMSLPGSDSNLDHPAQTSSNELAMDPEQIHLEALRKLGLLKNDETNSSPILNPKRSPKSRSSWAAPGSPLLPATPQSSTPPATPSYAHISSRPPFPEPLPSPSPAVESLPHADQPAEVLPAPPAFSDPVEPLWSDTEPTGDVKTQENTPPVISPPMGGLESAPRDRSSPGLSNYTISPDLSESGPSVSGDQIVGPLRNARPRPASLGSKTEFSNIQEAGLQAGQAPSKDLSSRRSLHASGYHHSADPQKQPGSYGVSVLICPRGQSQEARREALKKLGLLRD